MLKPQLQGRGIYQRHQPPSGGCVLKLGNRSMPAGILTQPPSGGCVLKPRRNVLVKGLLVQPPSGGCVLKQQGGQLRDSFGGSAAFGRLRVETTRERVYLPMRRRQPPSGGCVLKLGVA